MTDTVPPPAGSLPFLRLKICGITSLQDGQQAAAAGADAVGLNFYPGSPRCVSLPVALAITQGLPAHVAKVGVFVDSTSEEIQATVHEVGLDIVQLHGHEPPELIGELAPRQVVRAVRLERHRLPQWAGWLRMWQELPRVPWILVDAAVAGTLGGTGRTADWDAARQLRSEYTNVHFILAGGLTPNNVAQAIQRTGFHAVDTASGVETAPGRKDADAMRRFVKAARQAWEGGNVATP